MGFRFHWAVYFFLPPIFLARFAGWLVVPLSIAAAAAWLWLRRGTLDIVLLVLAAAAAVGVAWMVEIKSPAARPSSRPILIGCANFIWFDVLLFPVRWIAKGLAGI
jgi:hypothetical protein